MTDADSAHVQAHLQRAQRFLTHIGDRRQTLRRVSDYVMDHQEAFLRHGHAMFFKASLSVHAVLREIIEGEDHPLTDTDLAAELARRGYKVARRTVAKYRNEMGVPPSSLR